MKLQCFKPTVKGGAGSVDVWGGFSMYGMGPIHKINGIVDQTIYKNIIKDVLLSYSEEYLPLNWIFMQDKDPKHKAKFVTKSFEDEKSEFINMAIPIPGFKSIGKCLGEMGRALNNQKCKSLEKLYENV